MIKDADTNPTHAGVAAGIVASALPTLAKQAADILGAIFPQFAHLYADSAAAAG